jgi:D-amino-acid dehydrogenase
MRTIVVGGGVVGVTTAYYLAKEGHEVVVIDKATDVGSEATAVNAGLIAPAHCFAWASPAAPKMLVKSLFGEKTSIRVKPTLSPRFLWWGLQFMRECTPERAAINTLAKMHLCDYSQDKLKELSAEEGIDYQGVDKGLLYLYRDQEELDLGMKKMQLLMDNGQKLNQLDMKGLAAVDSAFANSTVELAGAIHAPNDGSGNSELFTKKLTEILKGMGVEFKLGTTAKAFLADGNKITAVKTDKGDFTADNFVLAMGVWSPALSRTVGQSLPVYPAKGFSMTFDIKDKSKAPELGGVDEKTLVAWSPMGDKIRISSTAQFSGFDRSHKPEDFAAIRGTASELWPDAADWQGGTMTAGLRPMTPDGPPIIGKGAKHSNLYYNTGHGHMGWTMSCGSSAAIVDVIAGRTPALNLDAFVVRSIRK